MIRFLLPFFALFPAIAQTQTTRHVGAGYPYPNLTAAVAAVQPADTIEVHAGTYPGGLFFNNLQGLPGQWITIRAAAGETVLFEDGGNAIQLTDPAYLHLRGLVFQHQTGNGLNTDDGGSYSSPAHHIIFEDCVFRDLSATGNNDLLKLSGLDDFEVRRCTFLNGAAGGSGIDMVGCHRGLIRGNRFENLGSNSIQAKGGTQHIRIEGNSFKNGGARAVNLGGSTGLSFFRPDTAHFEAADLQVYANVFAGSQAAVAYVGCVRVEVVNNTIYLPEKWVLRILQETVDPSRFLECGDNSFRNNIVVRNAGLSTETNTGPNTRPETFTFSNNLWYHTTNSNWPGPSIPVPESNGILNQNPLLADPANGNFSIPPGSPAAGNGLSGAGPVLDFFGNGFANPPSIGAAEANPVSSTSERLPNISLRLFPNPAAGTSWLEIEAHQAADATFLLSDVAGRPCQRVFAGHLSPGAHRWPVSSGLPPGIYFLHGQMDNTSIKPMVLIKI